MSKAKVLLFDIETAPVLAYVWGLWDQNVGLNQIHTDWFVLGWAAKWLNDPKDKIMYMDQRNAKNIEDDKKTLQGIWNLLDEADVVITQNGKNFDTKKLNARFVIQGFQPPSSYKHIDTFLIAKKYFGFTSNKLEYMADKLSNVKKSSHKKFPGFELWAECLKGNKEAWAEMESYNRKDVLALEGVYKKVIPWDASINFDLYTSTLENGCACGSKKFCKNGYFYSSVGKYQRYRCSECGAESRDRKNLFEKDKQKSLRVGTVK